MNRKKTKLMFTSRVLFEKIHIQGAVLDVVDEYIHQGKLIQRNTSSGEERKRSIILGW